MRGERQDFLKMGLKPGDEIVHDDTGHVAEIVNARTVRMHGKEISLTRASILAVGRRTPGKWRTRDGTRLKDLYERHQRAPV